METTPAFPLNRLVPARGVIAGDNGEFRITIEVAPFFYIYDDPQATDADNRGQLIDDYRAEIVESPLQFAELIVDAQTIEALAGREFTFPCNPEAGYYEGSLYLWSVHNPIDVLRVRFGEMKGRSIEAEFSLFYRFSFEGLCDDVQGELTVTLEKDKTGTEYPDFTIPFSVASGFDARARALLTSLHPFQVGQWGAFETGRIAPQMSAYFAEIGPQSLPTPFLYSRAGEFIGCALFREEETLIGLSVEVLEQYVALAQAILGLRNFRALLTLAFVDEQLRSWLQNTRTGEEQLTFTERFSQRATSNVANK